MLPREAAFHIPGLNISPLGVVSSGTPESPKLRIVHDLSFDVTREDASVNDRTDFASAPPVTFKNVLRNFVWRILYLRGRWPRGRIVLSKMDVAAAFRQVLVSWAGNQVFAYAFGDLLVIDRRLMFGWRNSPRYFCLFSDALRHSHAATSRKNAIVSKLGKKATQHVTVTRPPENEQPAALPLGCRVPPGSGGDVEDNFDNRYFLDDAMMAEIQHFRDGKRCLLSSGALASDHYRLFGAREPDDPPMLAAKKVSSWHTRLEVLGWTFDTVTMSIEVSLDKLHALRALLQSWPASRTVAVETDVRSLIGKLLYLCEVVRPGKFFVRRMLTQLGMGPMFFASKQRRFPLGARS